MCGVNTLHCSLRGCAKPSHNCPRLLIETSNSMCTLHLYYQNVCNNLHFKHCVDGTNSILWHMILYSHADDRSKVNVSPVWLAPQRRSGCISCRGEPGRSILADGTWGFWFTLWQRSGEPRRGRLEGSTALIDWWSFASHRWTLICAPCHKTSPDWHSYQSVRAPTVLRQTVIQRLDCYCTERIPLSLKHSW